MSDLKKQFEEIDTDSSGFLCIEEFTAIIRGSTIPLAADVIDAMFQVVDEERDGMINYVEFLSMMDTGFSENRIELDTDLDVDSEMEMLSTFCLLYTSPSPRDS